MANIGIDLGAAMDGEPATEARQLGLDLRELLVVDQPLEHVEAGPPVGLDDVGVKCPVTDEPDRSPVADLEGSPPPLGVVRLDCFLLGLGDRHGPIVADASRAAKREPDEVGVRYRIRRVRSSALPGGSADRASRSR